MLVAIKLFRPFIFPYSSCTMLLLLLLASMFLSVGCSARSSYSVSVNSFATDAASIPSKNYVLMPLDEKVTLDDLEFKEYAKYINLALAGKGFTLVEKIKNADQIIFLGYRISEPQQKIGTSSTPIIGQTGVASSSTYGIYNRGTGTYSSTTYNTPTYGITGYRQRTYSYTLYTRSLYIISLELKHEKKPLLGKELWKVIAVSTGSSGDLRSVFPALVTAAKGFFAVDPGRSVTLEIDVKDPTKILE